MSLPVYQRRRSFDSRCPQLTLRAACFYLEAWRITRFGLSAKSEFLLFIKSQIMVSSVEKHVRATFSDKADLDEDILAYMITCLEDETFKFDENGEEIYDTVGDMLVRCNSSMLCTDFQCPLWINSHQWHPPRQTCLLLCRGWSFIIALQGEFDETLKHLAIIGRSPSDIS
jgi:hypothetical protein